MLSIFRTTRLFTILVLYGLIVSGAAPVAVDWCAWMDSAEKESAPCHGAGHETDPKDDPVTPLPVSCCCELGVATEAGAVPVVSPTGKDTHSSRVATLPATLDVALRGNAPAGGHSPGIVPLPFHSNARQAYLCSFLN